ncbi:thiamine pyrophosphokinase [Exophiala sideris]|uniref:Thiamine pyrophosphokinase n=1 Tax=Exophiala sideris TaxID=1016849 RepID=A0ABR0J478_9EURO|nr:thiamine pyrophosphokinase [Exophiala sideris]KAK5055031.1 thiamine pyrophosphokinase [Exophiala sideris]KAK5179912.1 thiamine pyrophosphokinase [Eurotiomycetes sp. CCFEE 6388]
MSSAGWTTWHPCGLLGSEPVNPFAIIILNQPLNEKALDAVIRSASLLVCADGGANRLYKYDQDKRNFKSRLPDAIIGDFDSLSKSVEEHYRAQGVHVIKEPDQYSTDFTKCLKWIRTWCQKDPNSPSTTMDVVVLGGLGGRVDQGFSQIHHLYMAENDEALLKGRIYLLSEQIPGYFEENVGIIPVLGRTILTTSGLEWDVHHWTTEFGGQVSTSNHIRSDKIEISFQGPRPLFTMELHKSLTATGS